MKLIRKFKKHELILIVICFIMILVFISDVAIRQINLKFSRMEEEIMLNQRRLFKLNAILRQSNELNLEYQSLISGYKEFNDAGALLQNITDIAKKVNMNILNIKPGASKEEVSYDTYSVKIEVQDSVASLAKFLNLLSEELRSINIEQLQISTQGKDELPKAVIVLNAARFKI